MSDFGDKLRQRIAQKGTSAYAAAKAQEEAQAEAAKAKKEKEQSELERYLAADVTAAALVADVFAPLVEEFREVMESDGVLRESMLRAEHPRITQRDYGIHRFVYRATGIGSWRPVFEVRLATTVRENYFTECGRAAVEEFLCGQGERGEAAAETFTIRLAAECVRQGPPDDLDRPTWQTLAQFPSQVVAAVAGVDLAARQWAEGVLQQSAEAMFDAVSSTQGAGRVPVAPVAPPVATFVGFTEMV